MRYPPCDKCGKRTRLDCTCQAYSDTKKMMVRLCRECANAPADYHLTFRSRRKIGEIVPKRR